MKAFFWAAGVDGSSFYRQSLPTTGLQWRGHQVTTSTQLSMPQVRGCDAVIGARIATAAATDAWRTLRAAGMPLILDLDDNYFALDETNAKAFEFWNRDGMLSRLKANMDAADLVTVVSEGLAENMRALTATPVHVVPNFLPAQYLGAPRQYCPDNVTVGWAGSSSTIHELPLVAHAVGKIPDLNRGIKVKLVGCTLQEAALMGVKGPHVTATGWIRDVPTYLKECMRFDVWLAPYRKTLFNRAKYPTKALEAAFLGIPLLASNTRPYVDWVEQHGDACGVVLTKHEYDWTRNLKSLTDPFVGDVVRQQHGHAASSVAAQHILQSGAERWEEAIAMAKQRKKAISYAGR